MTKAPNAERLTLSRFFHKNRNTVKSTNVFENFNKSTNFCSIINENKRIDKRKKGKRKIFGPQFKGFTNEDQNRSEVEREKVNQITKKVEREFKKDNSVFDFSKEERNFANGYRLGSKVQKYPVGSPIGQTISDRGEGEDFFGFTQEERDNANGLTKKTKKETETDHSMSEIINTSEEGSDFFGFPIEETNNLKYTEELNNSLIDSPLEPTIDNFKKSNDFLGFSTEETDRANFLSFKIQTELEYLKNNTSHCCRGFSKREQHESISALSDILEQCVSIRNEIYKNIDRRILTYHLKKENSRKTVVCSKYWLKKEDWAVKEEDVSRIKVNGMKSENSGLSSFKLRKKLHKNSELIKKGVKIEDSESKDGTEMKKIHQEVKAIRNNNNSAPREDIKPEIPTFIKIKNELIFPPFIPPKSPHKLIEEELYHDPWALLVATIFLNRTSGRSARPYVFWFLEENPDPLVVLGKKVEQLETYFGALGLQKTRASQVWRMSHDFIYKKWQKVSELYGIGRYGEEAFRIFCLGDFSFVPHDRYLKIYSAWYEIQEKNARLKEMNS